jgi:hypothetical protein
VVAERFGVEYHERTIGKLLKRLGFSHVSSRPRHPGQDARTIEAFKKTFPQTLSAHLGAIADTKPVEIWFQMLCGRTPLD